MRVHAGRQLLDRLTTFWRDAARLFNKIFKYRLEGKPELIVINEVVDRLEFCLNHLVRQMGTVGMPGSPSPILALSSVTLRRNEYLTRSTQCGGTTQVITDTESRARYEYAATGQWLPYVFESTRDCALDTWVVQVVLDKEGSGSHVVGRRAYPLRSCRSRSG